MGKETDAVINNYRDLRVWQAGMNLVECVYRITQEFPKSEIYGLTGQMRRAAVSVPSNIAEGHVREHLKEYLQFVAMAQGSLAELQTQAEIALRLGYVSQSEYDQVSNSAISLAKQLYSLRNALTRKIDVTIPVP